MNEVYEVYLYWYIPQTVLHSNLEKPQPRREETEDLYLLLLLSTPRSSVFSLLGWGFSRFECSLFRIRLVRIFHPVQVPSNLVRGQVVLSANWTAKIPAFTLSTWLFSKAGILAVQFAGKTTCPVTKFEGTWAQVRGWKHPKVAGFVWKVVSSMKIFMRSILFPHFPVDSSLILSLEYFVTWHWIMMSIHVQPLVPG